jgi:hypothetical protein
MTTKVYLIGDANSPKTNQWLSMTDCPNLAVARALEVGPEATRKTITVAPPRGQR